MCSVCATFVKQLIANGFGCRSIKKNKVAEYYRKSKDLKTAFIYYEEAINCPLREKNYYAYYNLAKYYYFAREGHLRIIFFIIFFRVDFRAGESGSCESMSRHELSSVNSSG